MTKHKGLRVLAFLLAFVLLASVMPMSIAFAEENEEGTGSGTGGESGSESTESTQLAIELLMNNQPLGATYDSAVQAADTSFTIMVKPNFKGKVTYNWTVEEVSGSEVGTLGSEYMSNMTDSTATSNNIKAPKGGIYEINCTATTKNSANETVTVEAEPGYVAVYSIEKIEDANPKTQKSPDGDYIIGEDVYLRAVIYPQNPPADAGSTYYYKWTVTGQKDPLYETGNNVMNFTKIMAAAGDYNVSCAVYLEDPKNADMSVKPVAEFGPVKESVEYAAFMTTYDGMKEVPDDPDKPENFIVGPDSNLTLTANVGQMSANGRTVTYQWYKTTKEDQKTTQRSDWQAIDGATSYSFKPTLDAVGTGRYRFKCIATIAGNLGKGTCVTNNTFTFYDISTNISYGPNELKDGDASVTLIPKGAVTLNGSLLGPDVKTEDDIAVTWTVRTPSGGIDPIEQGTQTQNGYNATYEVKNEGTYTFTCAARSGNRNNVYASKSTTVTFKLNQGTELSATPEHGVAVSKDKDNPVKVTLKATAEYPEDTYSVQWQQKNTTGGWTDLPGENKLTCEVWSQKSGTITYRCNLMSGKTIYSTLGEKAVNFYEPTIAPAAAAKGMPASLSVSFDNPKLSTEAPVKYQWFRVNAGNKVAITASSSTEDVQYSGFDTPVLTVTENGKSDEYEFACEVSYNGGTNTLVGEASGTLRVYDVTLTPSAVGVGVDEKVTIKPVVTFGEKEDIVTVKKDGLKWSRSTDGNSFTEFKPDVDGQGAATFTETTGGAYSYRVLLPITETINGKQQNFTILSPAADVAFYSLELDASAASDKLWQAGAPINLEAYMSPETAPNGVQYDYTWYEVAKDGQETPVEGPQGQTTQVTPEDAGTHTYKCVVRNGLSENNDEIISETFSFETYKLQIVEPVRKVNYTEEEPWLNTGDDAKFVVEGGPSGGKYVWRWHKDTETEFTPEEGLEAPGSTFTHTQTNGGKYVYKCDVLDTTGKKIAELETTVTFYGVSLEPSPNMTDDNNEIFVPFGTAPPAHILAEVEPHPGLGASGQYYYDWYIWSGGTWEAIDGAQNSGASLRVDDVSVGNRRYRCVAKSAATSDPKDVVGTGEVDFMVHYIVEVIADPDEDLAAGDEVTLTAITDPKATIEGTIYEWYVRVGENDTFRPVVRSDNSENTDNTIKVKLPSTEQTYRCLIRVPGEIKHVGLGQTKDLAARYPLQLEADPATGMVGYPDDVTLTAKCNPAPAAPKYRWEMKSGEEWIQVPGSSNGPELRVQQESSTPTEYRCLMGSKKAPTDVQDENCLGIAEFTVTGYALEMTEIEDPNVSAGKSVTLEAKITPKTPIGDITYQWYVSTTGKYEPIPDTNSNKVQVVPPEGGEYDYRCVATLPGGRTVSNEISLSSTQRNFKVTVTPGEGDISQIPLGKPFTLTATVNSNPKDVVEWQWQQLEKGGWVDVQRTDATEPTMTLLPDETGTWHYRAVAVVSVEADGGAKSTVRSADITTTFVEGSADSDSSLKPWGGGSSSSSNSGNADFPLTSGARFTITNTKPYRVKGISAASKGVGMTVQDVLKSFVVREADGQRVQMVDKNGRVKSPTDPVCTGDVVTLIGPNNSELNRATVVVNGDVLGNGKMQLSQIVKMAQHMKSSTLTDVYLEAGDWTGTGDIGLSDLVVQAKELKNATTK